MVNNRKKIDGWMDIDVVYLIIDFYVCVPNNWLEIF